MALNAASRSPVSIAKPGESIKPEQAKIAAQAPTTEEPVVLAPEDVVDPVATLVTQGLGAIAANAAQLPALPLESQSLPQPAIDLSLSIGPKVGLRAPDFVLQALDGKTYQLSELTGRPVLINYWTTWCIPCKAELPILEKLHQEYQPKGVLIISVNAINQDSLDKVQGTVNEFSMTFPVLLDQGDQFASLYQAMFFPTTILVDASGVIREITLGDSTEAELRASLDKALAGGL